MHRYAFPVPLLPGHDPGELAAVFDGRQDEYVESRRRLGIHVERIYAQPGMLVVYLESEWDYGTTLAAQVQSDIGIDAEFRDRFWQVLGVEVEDLAVRPAPELVGEWLDPAVTKRRNGVAFSFVLKPQMAAAARQFGEDAFHHRRYENTMSRRALPLTVERVFLNQGPDIDRLTFYLEADDPAAGYERLAASTAVHDQWFKAACSELFAEAPGLNAPQPVTRTIWDVELEVAPTIRA